MHAVDHEFEPVRRLHRTVHIMDVRVSGDAAAFRLVAHISADRPEIFRPLGDQEFAGEMHRRQQRDRDLRMVFTDDVDRPGQGIAKTVDPRVDDVIQNEQRRIGDD